MSETAPKIYTCAEWDAAAPRGSNVQRTPQGIILHHTVSLNRRPESDPEEELERAKRLARDIQREHMSRRRPARDSLQNFTISRGGLIMEGRCGSLRAAQQGRMVQGGHTRSEQANRTRWGIECEGTYHITFDMPAQQRAAIVELCAWLSFWGEFQAASIGGHQEFSPTQCPGHIMDQLPSLREEVRDRKLVIMESFGQQP